MIRKLVVIAIASIVLLSFAPSQQVNQIELPEGESQFVCSNLQVPTLVPPDKAICSPIATATPLPVTSFLETFDGAPGEPQAYQSDNWDIAVHSRDRDWWYSLESMMAMHGSMCEAPPQSHLHNTYENAAFSCNNHLMTAIKASGYGMIVLTSNRLVDFSNGEAVVRFDVSTLRTSYRDWIDLWITPYESNLMLPLEDWLPDLNGEPQNAIHIRMRFGTGSSPSGSFEGAIIRDFISYSLSQNRTTGYETYFVPSATNRETFELRVSNTHIKFGMPEYDLWWIDTNIDSIEWNQGILQLSHHSYNPLKSCATCLPDTWHWDNVSIDPAIPFTMIHADRRYVDITQLGALTFASPSPSNAHLRFSGIGDNIEFSTNGGSTWQVAQMQLQEEYHSDHFRTYWTPIESGVTSIMMRGENWWGGNWHARDISIWSRTSE